MNHRFQFPDVIALVGKGPLGDDASAVQLGVDVMDRHAEATLPQHIQTLLWEQPE